MPKQTKKDLKDIIDDLNARIETLESWINIKDLEIEKRELEYQFLSDEYDEMLKHKNRIIKKIKSVARTEP